MADAKAKSLEYKAEGNAALSSQDYAEAIECYTKAIELDPTNHVFFSNRSAAKLSSGDAEGALADAEGCIAAKPDWKKGYGRKGAALHQLHRWEDATAAYDAGLELAPGDAALVSGKKDVSSAEERAAMSAMGGLGVLFSGMNGAQASGLLGMLGSDDKSRMLGGGSTLLVAESHSWSSSTWDMHRSATDSGRVISALGGEGQYTGVDAA